MNTKSDLLNLYPDSKISIERYELDEQSFQDQKLKHDGRDAEGGAIGIIWLDQETVVLGRRTRLHPGWALLGGTVEKGQTFNEAFEREAKEESGLHVHIARLVMVELKIFVSPKQEELRIDLAVFEAEAEPGQILAITPDAQSEGLEVRAFNISDIPDEMIMKDREKLDRVISERLKI